MEVLVAYTGARHSVSPSHESLSALGRQVEAQTGVPADRQLLLVQSSGKRLRLETAVPDQRVFVYDKSLIRGQLPHPSPPEYPLLERAPSEAASAEERAQWANTARSKARDPLGYIQATRKTIPVIIAAALLAEKHMETHLKSVRQMREKKQAAYTQVAADLASCSSWRASWDAYRQVLGLSAKIELLDQASTTAAWDAANELATEIKAMLAECEVHSATLKEPPHPAEGDEKLLDVDMSALTAKVIEGAGAGTGAGTGAPYSEIAKEIEAVYSESVEMAQSLHRSLVDAQVYLLATIREVSQVQTAGAQTKLRLAEITQKLHEMDSHKVQVAKVIDFPFIYGVSLIETSRRHSWSAAVEHLRTAAMAHFEQLRETEYQRIDRWTSHYSSLGLIDRLVSVDVKLPTVEMHFKGIELEDTPDINSYLSSLGAAGFTETVSDLRSELNAMSQQLERSFRATSKTQALFPNMNASQVIREEQIRDQVRFEVRAGAESDLRERIEGELRGSARALEEAILSKERVLQELDARAAAKERELEDALAAKKRALRELEEAAAAKELALRELEEAARAKESALFELEEAAAAKESVLRESSDRLGSQGSYIQELQDQVNKMQNNDARLVESLEKTHDMAQRLYANSHHLENVLEKMGLQTVRKVEGDMVSYGIERVHGVSRRASSTPTTPDANVSASSMVLETVPPVPRVPDPSLLNWVFAVNNDEEFRLFLQKVYIDYDIFRQVVGDRFGEVEKIARKYHGQVKANRERIRELERSLRHRLALNQFKVGDLILFLPTRDSVRTPNPWAAFNINSPQYFLDPENAKQLGAREFVVGRATAIVQHKVCPGDTGDANPFNLPEGLVWNMITAQWK